MPFATALVGPRRRRRSRPRRPRRTRPPPPRSPPAAGSRFPRATPARRPASITSVPCAGFAYFSHSLNELCPVSRGANLVPSRSPAEHRLERPVAQAVADHRRDARRRGHVGGDHLRAHPPRAQRRGRVADLELLERLEVADLRDQRRGRVDARIGAVEAVDVRQQHQQIGADEHRHLRRQEVVVAEGDLVGRGRVVLVDHRHHPPVAAACATSAGRSGSACARSDRRSSAAPARSSPRARAAARRTPCTAFPARPRSRPAARRSPPGAPAAPARASPARSRRWRRSRPHRRLRASRRPRRRCARAPPRATRRCPRRRCSTRA